jgi:hypothetical protein
VVRIERFLVPIALSIVLLWPLGGAKAQLAQCTLSPTPDCRTGAEGRPSFLGVSGGNITDIGHGACCTGTLGALVQDRHGHQFVLSNNHVLARTSTINKSALVGESIVQPGLTDTGCFIDTGNSVARLARWVPLDFRRTCQNEIDAALANVSRGKIDQLGTLLNVGPISGTPFPVSQLRIGMFVKKMGRSSCLTVGQINAFDSTGKIGYLKQCRAIGSGTARFVHQILIFPACGTFVQEGDSGSVVLTDESCPRAIGLLFAGSSNGLGVINPILRVLHALNVSIVPGCVNSGGQPAAEQDSLRVEAELEGPSEAFRKSVAVVRAVKEKHEKDLIDMDEVAAVGISQADDADHAALTVFVTRDTPDVRAKVPSELEGVPVKIVESGEFRAL